MGGKRKLATEVLKHFGDHKCYVEPFCGGAAVFFKKQESEIEVINDINLGTVIECQFGIRMIKINFSQISWPATSSPLLRFALFVCFASSRLGEPLPLRIAAIICGHCFIESRGSSSPLLRSAL